MKRVFRAIALILVCAVCFSLTAMAAQTPKASEEMRGVWVSSVYNLDYPKKPTTDPDILKAQADEILDNCVKWGLNAVFLQVRPSSDALYPSEIFPWSKYLTGKQGTQPANGFDPLAYWVEAAHKRGLELHAWINPYRITKGKQAEWDSLVSTHPAKKNPEWTVQYTDGNYYFDPGLPEVRDLVVQGAVEIAKNYDIDGLHMDDYFYPGKDFPDSKTYEAYGKGFLILQTGAEIMSISWCVGWIQSCIRSIKKSSLGSAHRVFGQIVLPTHAVPTQTAVSIMRVIMLTAYTGSKMVW